MRRSKNRRRWVVVVAVLGVLLLGLLLHPLYLTAIGKALIVEDALEKSDVILVFAGDNRKGDRVSHAVRLFKTGYAPLLVLSGTPLGWRTHEADVMRREAEELGVPPAQIITVGHDSDSTKEEAAVIVPVLRKQQAHTVILVTSSFHTARAKRVLQKAAERREFRILASPVQEDAFYPEGWWTRRRDAKTFFFESVKTAWYWIAE
jgi:uncharacterized SAM-binding protein YcdF (DUF218 family)